MQVKKLNLGTKMRDQIFDDESRKFGKNYFNLEMQMHYGTKIMGSILPLIESIDRD